MILTFQVWLANYNLWISVTSVSHTHLSWAGILTSSCSPQVTSSRELRETAPERPTVFHFPQTRRLASRTGEAKKGSKILFPDDALFHQAPLNYVLLLIGMMMARAEHVTVCLCGGGSVKTPVLAADEGILKTAIKLQAQVQVRNTAPLSRNIRMTEGWAHHK